MASPSSTNAAKEASALLGVFGAVAKVGAAMRVVPQSSLQTFYNAGGTASLLRDDLASEPHTLIFQVFQDEVSLLPIHNSCSIK